MSRTVIHEASTVDRGEYPRNLHASCQSSSVWRNRRLMQQAQTHILVWSKDTGGSTARHKRKISELGETCGVVKLIAVHVHIDQGDGSIHGLDGVRRFRRYRRAVDLKITLSCGSNQQMEKLLHS